MQSLAKSVEAAYPGMYAVSVNVANGFLSFVTPMWQQVDEFAAVVRADPKLAGGFNVAGLSQGGPVVRGYIEKYNSPPVHNFVSICGVQGGEFNCPLPFQLIPFLCDSFLSSPYGLVAGLVPLSFSDYWVDSQNMTRYFAENKFLVPLNNQQRDSSLLNATFKANFASLNKLVLIEALNDTVVYPSISEQFGGYVDGSLNVTYNFTTWQPYLSDSFGLRTLVDGGKVQLGSFTGNHLRFTTQYWDTHVLPWFNTTLM
jgi:palmitoyl-protein thioesterase